MIIKELPLRNEQAKTRCNFTILVKRSHQPMMWLRGMIISASRGKMDIEEQGRTNGLMKWNLCHGGQSSTPVGTMTKEQCSWGETAPHA
jgi:hypothetical protein